MPLARILKINFFAILSFPLLIISIAALMVAKATEKALVFIGVGAAFLGLALLNAIINNAGALFEGLAIIIAALIFFGTIVLIVGGIVVLMISAASAIFYGVANLIISLFERIFSLAGGGYARLHDLIGFELDALDYGGERGYVILACPFWLILTAVHYIAAKLFIFALPLSVAASVGIDAYILYSINTYVDNMFGIDAFAYVRLFPPVNAVFSILYISILIFSVASVLISLGVEWKALGTLLDEMRRGKPDTAMSTALVPSKYKRREIDGEDDDDESGEGNNDGKYY